MRLAIVFIGLALLLWPVAGFLVGLAVPSLLGFFASGTVVVAYASVAAGLAVILVGFAQKPARPAATP